MGCQSSSGVEQRTHKPLVGGSNPSSGTSFNQLCFNQLLTAGACRVTVVDRFGVVMGEEATGNEIDRGFEVVIAA